jgi:succinate dehydrogenase / fumarate reductase flavoprotein subunit
MYHQFKELADIDITTDPMEVGPTTHYMMGGVRVDPDTQMSPTVPGLFAAGECAAGLHGANRLGGNSLSDLLVFGKRAGEHAAAHAARSSPPNPSEAAIAEAARAALAPFERTHGENPFAIQHELQDTMQNLVGIVRSEDDMLAALERIQEYKNRARNTTAPGNREYNPGWHTALDLVHLLTVSEAITRAAVLRRESRGAHFREDYPGKDSAWGKQNIVVRKAHDGSMELESLPTPVVPAELAAVIEENQ